MRLAEPIACIGVVCLWTAPAAAQDVAFDIPAGRLSDALIVLAGQANITIGANDPGLAAVKSRRVRGRMTARQALSRLLEGTGYQFTFVSAGAVRVTRTPRVAPPGSGGAARASAPPYSPSHAPDGVIVVEASKQHTPLDTFAGGVHIVALAPTDVGRFGTRGSEAVVARLPTLASTSLGPGRNKVFIRGVADSSFNGPSQALVSQYLGDVRLAFNAPDPDLQLYDISRIEVLEGPQGTLYGTGSLGGIMRLVPNAPDPSQVTASFSGGLLATRHGDLGGEVSGVLNVPLAPERLTFRGVAYAANEGGYIDDAGRGLADVNRVTVHGGRAALLLTPGDDWEVELGGAVQFIAARDGQYAERNLPPLTRRSAIAQPFDNDYRMGSITVRKHSPSFELISATSVVDHDLDTTFDASDPATSAAPQVFREDIGITLLANETRVSSVNSAGADWVVGISLLHNSSNIRRRLGPLAAPLPITGVRNVTSEGALFGQVSLPLSDRITGTLGGRLTFSRSLGEPLDATTGAEEPTRSDLHPTPTAALSWRAAGNVFVYARYQHGFRAGGLAISATGSAMAVERFESDNLSSLEAGVRVGDPGSSRFSLNAAVSYARWANIQADLIDGQGLPYTTNLGDGRISGLEIEGSWQATPSLRLDAAAFLNESALTEPDPPFAAADERDFPNVAGIGGRAAAHYQREVAQGAVLSVDATLRYVGPSQLGIGPPLDAQQGDYFDSQLGGRIDFGRVGLSLDVDNLFDARGNRFAFGNPFTVDLGNQVTPLRPRTVRLGIDAAF